MRLQVCVISVLTSVVLFALPLGGRCHVCDSENTAHCVKSKEGGAEQSIQALNVQGANMCLRHPKILIGGLHPVRFDPCFNAVEQC